MEKIGDILTPTFKNKRRKLVGEKIFETMNHGKLPPQAIELEEAVLGAMMLEKNAVTALVDKLKPEHFYKEAHQKIYSAIERLFHKGEAVDMLTTLNELKVAGDLELAGGAYYITQLTSRISSSANIEYHAHIVLQKYIQRELIRISSEVIEDAYDDRSDVFDLLDKAESNLFGIAEGTLRGNPDQMKDLLGEAIQQISKAQNQKDGLTGIPSGFSQLDRATSGWQKSDLVIIASRPGVGKTSFVLSIARNIGVRFNIPVAIFSLEMSSRQLVMRLISNETELDADKLKRGQLSMAEWEQLNAKISSLEKAPIFIDDTPALSIFELRAKCRRLMAKHKIQIAIIDYLQLMSGGEQQFGKSSREQEISKISRSLKNIAKELDIPIIALSQLSRNLEHRSSSKRPILSDLRESGAIEQDADLVMFIYRPETHDLYEWEDGSSSAGEADIIIAKHRNGATGKVRMKFINRLAKFDDMPDFLLTENGKTSDGGQPQTYTMSSKMNEEEEPF